MRPILNCWLHTFTFWTRQQQLAKFSRAYYYRLIRNVKRIHEINLHVVSLRRANYAKVVVAASTNSINQGRRGPLHETKRDKTKRKSIKVKEPHLLWWTNRPADGTWGRRRRPRRSRASSCEWQSTPRSLRCWTRHLRHVSTSITLQGGFNELATSGSPLQTTPCSHQYDCLRLRFLLQDSSWFQ